MESEPRFFSSSEELRSWFEEHHGTEDVLWVGFYKKATGKQTISWSDAVDQALCFGWIDGVRKTIDEESYANRFTPRRPNSNWSAVNVAKVERLTKEGLMTPSGLAAFAKRREDKTAVYSYERRDQARFDAQQLKLFKANPAAWEFFSAQPPGYRKLATFWVVSGKRDETRTRRLGQLIEASAAERRLAQLSQPRPRSP